MEFREARSLAVLGKVGTMARTAQEVNLTPAAVHKQLKNLECEFGVRLYEKSGRNVHLTQAAQVILPYLEELLADYDAVAAVLTEWKGAQRGFVRIGANPAVSSFLLPGLLKDFREMWPGVTAMLEVDASAALLERIANRSLDVAICLWNDADRQFGKSHACWEFDVVTVAAARSGAAYTCLADLAAVPFISLPPGTVLTSRIDGYLSGCGFQPSEVIVVNNSHTMISLIAAGLGFGLLPIWAVAADVEAGRLAVIPTTAPPLTGKLDLISARTGYIPPPVRAFIELARSHGSGDYLRLTEPRA